MTLSIDQPDTSREPNDTPNLVSELVFPGETSGGIEAALDPTWAPTPTGTTSTAAQARLSRSQASSAPPR